MKYVQKIALLALLAITACIGFTPQTVEAQAFAGSCAAVRGSFTGTFTGFASPPTGTVQFRVTNACQVTLWVTTAITGTSNAATATLTGLPYNLWPNIGSVQLLPNIFTDNTATVIGCISVPSQAGTITFSNTGACAGAVTASGTKALQAGWNTTYTLY